MMQNESIQINKEAWGNSQSDLGMNKNTYPTTIGSIEANKYGCLLPIEEFVLSEIDPIIGSVKASKNKAIAIAKPASPGSKPTTFP